MKVAQGIAFSVLAGPLPAAHAMQQNPDVAASQSFAREIAGNAGQAGLFNIADFLPLTQEGKRNMFDSLGKGGEAFFNTNVRRDAAQMTSSAITQLKQRRNPLLDAVQEGDAFAVSAVVDALKKVKVIKAQGPNQTGAQGQPLLHRAVRGINLSPAQRRLVVAALVQAPGLDVNGTCGVDQYTALHYAAMAQNADMVAALCAAPGIDVNKTGRSGETPLFMAFIFAKPIPALVENLVAAGADVNKLQGRAAGAWKRSTLHVAVRSWKYDAQSAPQSAPGSKVDLLLNLPGINVNRPDAKGRTPLHDAVETKNVDAVARLLRADHIDINQADEDERTPLDVAADLDNPDRDAIMALLLEHSSKPKKRARTD